MPPKTKKIKEKKNAIIYEPTKEYPDRAEEKLRSFPKFNIEAHEPETLVLLLATKENDVLLHILNHLVKYAEKLPENAAVLHNLNTLEKISENNLWNHELLFIKRFTLKLAGEIFQLENEKFDRDITQKLFTISHQTYLANTDDFLVEYSSVLLYELLREPEICSAIEADSYFIDNVFKHITKTSDPDILFNSYKILTRLYNSVMSISRLCKNSNFPFENILSDISCEYKEIQEAALMVLGQVATCNNEFFETRFGCAVFFEEIFKILKNDLRQDHHLIAIEIVKQLMSAEKIAKFFCRQNYLSRFVVFVNEKEPYKLEAVGVLVAIAQYPEHLDSLYLFGVVDLLLKFLENFDKVNSEICIGLNRLLRHPESFNKIVQEDPAPDLINIIKSDAKNWELRNAATETLNSLIKRNFKTAENSVKNNIGVIISKQLVKKIGAILTDFLLNLIHTLIALATDPETRHKVMTEDLASSFLEELKNAQRSAIILANILICASAYIIEESLQKVFLAQKGTDLVLNALKSVAMFVKSAAIDFVLMSGKLQKFGEEYINNGVLEYLLRDEDSISISPNWSSAIDAILSTNLSLKFLVRRRLEITDITGDNFIVSKHHFKDFKVFINLLNDEVSPYFSTILVNFHNAIEHSSQSGHGDNDLASIWKYSRSPADHRLPDYLNKLRNTLEARGLIEKCRIPNSIDITSIADRVRIIAELVCSEMCGMIPNRKHIECSAAEVLTHLQELKVQLHCNIIPLGSIRVGGHFERAILFKVLADKIGLPTTLVYGIDQKILYNEVPLPEQEKTPDCACTILPMRLLCPTHIVDLVDVPGELYPILSRESFLYQRFK